MTVRSCLLALVCLDARLGSAIVTVWVDSDAWLVSKERLRGGDHRIARVGEDHVAMLECSSGVLARKADFCHTVGRCG